MLSDVKQEDLFSDSSEWCEVLQQKRLEGFDLDQYGVLSEEEMTQLEDKKQNEQGHYEEREEERGCKSTKKDKYQLLE